MIYKVPKSQKESGCICVSSMLIFSQHYYFWLVLNNHTQPLLSGHGLLSFESRCRCLQAGEGEEGLRQCKQKQTRERGSILADILHMSFMDDP